MQPPGPARTRLAAYAMQDCATRGRRYPEEPHPYRSEYQRDRDRVVHTKAFRRLERKTQVFAAHYSDHFRNRLTHTIEVSQISRTISAALGLNTVLCEVLALSHDIGHPPFGHEGERVLNEIMRRHGGGFDHNLHALRIVEDFEEKYASFRGLNLTFEVREGIVKHSRDYSSTTSTYLDLSDYRLTERPPLEAQLIDPADEIAYNGADLDDGYASGLLVLGQLIEEVTLFGQLFREVKRLYPDAPEKLKVSETVRRVIDTLVTNLVENTFQELESHQIDSVEQVRQIGRRLVNFDRPMGDLNHQLKLFLYDNLYNHKVLWEARQSAEQLLVRLFDYYLEQPRQLPEGHFLRIDKLGLERVVCEYIAGMTDSYAEETFRRLES